MKFGCELNSTWMILWNIFFIQQWDPSDIDDVIKIEKNLSTKVYNYIQLNANSIRFFLDGCSRDGWILPLA